MDTFNTFISGIGTIILDCAAHPFACLEAALIVAVLLMMQSFKWCLKSYAEQYFEEKRKDREALEAQNEIMRSLVMVAPKIVAAVERKEEEKK